MQHPRTISIAKESESPARNLRLQAHRTSEDSKTAVLFLHGYKGYADWGCWDLMCEALVGFSVHAFRLDFSGNGTSAETPGDIHDLESWSRNTYRQELQDTIAAVQSLRRQGYEVILMGHSRGGGIATIAAATLCGTMNAVKGLILLASVSDFERRFPKGEALEQWKLTNRWMVKNGRTGEIYHHKFHFYTDFLRHQDLLNIRQQAARVDVPVMVVHALDDQAVFASESRELASIFRHNVRVLQVMLESGGHTFGSMEPWPNGKPLPKEMADLLPEIGQFVTTLA